MVRAKDAIVGLTSIDEAVLDDESWRCVQKSDQRDRQLEGASEISLRREPEFCSSMANGNELA
jgi:hypothetical protein